MTVFHKIYYAELESCNNISVVQLKTDFAKLLRDNRLEIERLARSGGREAQRTLYTYVIYTLNNSRRQSRLYKNMLTGENQFETIIKKIKEN